MATACIVIQPQKSLFKIDLDALWQYRELLYFLVWRDVKVRYKQTAIGVVWALLQPLLTMALFTLVFSIFARIPSDGLPYPVFALSALLPWTYFSQAMARSGNSLVGDASLITKIYFPRLIIPLSAATAPAIDFFISFVLLLGLMAYYNILPTWHLLALPLFLFLAFITAFTAGLWLAPLNVRYRDVGYVIPFMIQLWMYACPVVYPISLVPERWRSLYSLNPMVAVIEGFRWALLGKEFPDLRAAGVSVIATVLLFLTGVVYFKRMERTLADVV
jgi:lipopolysaccharide transport system permease protein